MLVSCGSRLPEVEGDCLQSIPKKALYENSVSIDRFL